MSLYYINLCLIIYILYIYHNDSILFVYVLCKFLGKMHSVENQMRPDTTLRAQLSSAKAVADAPSGDLSQTCYYVVCLLFYCF